MFLYPADQEKEREVAQAKLREALLEKEQVSSDLNTMERSFSDLFKRLEKYKDVVEGYKKVRKSKRLPCYKWQMHDVLRFEQKLWQFDW